MVDTNMVSSWPLLCGGRPVLIFLKGLNMKDLVRILLLLFENQIELEKRVKYLEEIIKGE